MGCCHSNSDINIVKNEHGKIVMRSFDNKHDKSNGPRLKRHSTSTEDAVSMIVNGFCKEVFNELPMEFAVEAQKLMEVSLEGSVG